MTAPACVEVVPAPAKAEPVCAWCQRERGEAPQPGQSHGICARHKAEVLECYRRDVAGKRGRP